MRRRCLIATGALSLMTSPGIAEEDLAFTFSLCAGRLDALSQHQWMFSPPDYPQTAARRDAMAVLFEIVAQGPERQKHEAVRKGSRNALLDLLNRGAFNGDYEDVLWARQHANAQINACIGFLEHPQKPLAQR